MEEPGEDRIVPPPTDVICVSIWQRLKRLGLKKLLLICVGIGAGLGIGVIATIASVVWLTAYSGDVNGRFQRDVNGHSGHVNKVGAQRRWDYNHARHLRD